MSLGVKGLKASTLGLIASCKTPWGNQCSHQAAALWDSRFFLKRRTTSQVSYAPSRALSYVANQVKNKGSLLGTKLINIRDLMLKHKMVLLFDLNLVTTRQNQYPKGIIKHYKLRAAVHAFNSSTDHFDSGLMIFNTCRRSNGQSMIIGTAKN